MAFEAPSFSLGLDFELDSQPNPTAAPVPSPKRSLHTQNLHTIEEDDDVDFDFMVSGPEVNCSDPPLTLKRLVRGSTSRESTSVARSPNIKEGTLRDVDDDIEDFSSQEDRPEGTFQSQKSLSTSSKIPLHHLGRFSSATQSTLKGKKAATDSPAFQNKKKSDNIFMPSKQDVSPLRRFKLIDSDSDDPSHVPSHSEDLWKDFLTDDKFHFSTPALDEVCEEYFKSLSDTTPTNAPQNASEDNRRKTSLPENNSSQQMPTSHTYFFHKDSRIQKLVRDRLPHFFPLGAKTGQGVKQDNGSINYIGQFASKGDHESQTNKAPAEAVSTKRRKKDSPNVGWVNPKDSAGVAKDAGKRRVHAVGSSPGYWRTAPDGRRIYVTKNGEELTGRNAYIFHKKESGIGFKKSKGKSFAKSKKK